VAVSDGIADANEDGFVDRGTGVGRENCCRRGDLGDVNGSDTVNREGRDGAVLADLQRRVAAGQHVADDAVLHLVTDVFALRTRFFDDFFARRARCYPRSGDRGIGARRPSLPAVLAGGHDGI
jgi:hypothetical protein